MRSIYTIGYSTFKIDDFIKILQKYKITSLIDVRSNPNSKFHTDYNKNNLENVLKHYGIIYRNYKEFGARQNDLKFFNKSGYLDFNKYSQSKSFQNGVRKIQMGMSMNHVFVFMCAEKEPSSCHRNILVAREFYKKGYQIKNLLDDGSYETQESIEKSLVEDYFPNRNQLDIFSNILSWEEMVERSYELRNRDIGYKINDVKITENIL